MKNLLTIITILTLFMSCKKEDYKKEHEESCKSNNDGANYLNLDDSNMIFELKKGIMDNDTILYKKYYAIYLKSGHAKEFLYYALLMAEKNNSKTAYLNVAEILNDPIQVKYNFKSKFASFNLLKAYELGEKNAKQYVNYIYTEKGKPIPKSSSIYCSK